MAKRVESSEERAVRMLKKTVEDAQNQVKKGIMALKKASKGTAELAKEAKPLGRDLMRLADSIAEDFERAIPVMAKDLRSMEKAAVKKAENILRRK